MHGAVHEYALALSGRDGGRVSQADERLSHGDQAPLPAFGRLLSGAYKEDILQRQVTFGLMYLRAFKEKFPQVCCDVSPFFLKLSSTWWVNILTEIVSNDALTEAELEQGLREYVTFATAGWKELMHI